MSSPSNGAAMAATDSYLDALLTRACECEGLSSLLTFDLKYRASMIGDTSVIAFGDLSSKIFDMGYYRAIFARLNRVRPDLNDRFIYGYQALVKYLLWNLRYYIYSSNSVPSRSPMGNIPALDKPTTGASLPLSSQAEFFESLQEAIPCSNPDHISLPGDPSSYLQTDIVLASMDAYTITFWIKLDSKMKNTSVLARCTSPVGGIEISLLEKDSNHVWQILVKSTYETHTEKGFGRSEARFAMKIVPEKWHLISAVHAPGSPKELAKMGRKVSGYGDDDHIFSLSLNGIPQAEKDSPINGKELKFPFSHSSPREFHWFFGLELKGLISSISFYNGALDRNLLTLQYEQGPSFHNLHCSFKSPQGTLDSGYFAQGSVMARGKFCEKAVKSPLLFSITTDSFNLTSSGAPPSTIEMLAVPQRYAAIIHNGDLIQTSQINESTEREMKVRFSGKIEIVKDFNLLQSFPGIGGNICWIYLLWLYCTLLNQRTVAGESVLANNNNISSNNSNIGGLSSRRGRSNSDLNEGSGPNPIEIVGRMHDCLSTIYVLLKSSGEFREEFIQVHGFHLIGYCLSSIKDKERLISESIAQSCVDIVNCFDIDSRNGDGITGALQGLLMNLQIWGQCKSSVLKIIFDFICEKGEADKVRILHKAIGYQNVIDIFRIYIIKSNDSSSTLSSSLYVAPPPSSAIVHNAMFKIIRLTLESSRQAFISPPLNNHSTNYVAGMIDYILNCIEEDFHPILTENLISYLCDYILLDHTTVCLQRLVKKRFCETTLCLIISRPHTTNETKRCATHLLVRTINREFCEHIIQLHHYCDYLKAEGRANANSTMSTDAKRFYEASGQQNKTISHLLKAWKVLKYIGSLIRESAERRDEHETNSYTDGFVEGFINMTVMSSSDIEMQNLFLVAEKSNIWFMLPFLEGILSSCSPELYQKCIVAMNISLKTEVLSMEIIQSFPDKNLYIDVFLSLVTCKKLGGIKGSTADTILDSLVYIVDNRIKSKPDESWFILLQLESFITKKCSESKEEAHLLFTKVLTIFLQYIAKSANQPSNLIQNLNYFLVLGNNRGYCGNLIQIRQERKNSNNLLDIQDFEDDLLLFNSCVNDESLVCLHILEILRTYRNGKKESEEEMSSKEHSVFVLAWLTILSRLNELSDVTISHAFAEIDKTIQFLVSHTHEKNCYEEYVYDFFRINFTLLKQSIATASSSDRKDSFLALVYSLCHRLFDLKRYFERNKHPIHNYIVGDNPTTTSQMECMWEFVRVKFNIDISNLYQGLADLNQFPSFSFGSHSQNESVGDVPTLSTVSTSIISSSVTGTDFLTLSPSSVDGILLDYDVLSPSSERMNMLDDLWKQRRVLLQQRIETERARLLRYINTSGLLAHALGKYFKKKCHKLELEIFEDKYDCHWKLAVSNEGHLPARRRVALRPHARYPSQFKSDQRSGGGKEQITDQNELGKVLAKVAIAEDGGLGENEVADDSTVDLDETGKGSPLKQSFVGESWSISENDVDEAIGDQDSSITNSSSHSTGGNGSSATSVVGGNGVFVDDSLALGSDPVENDDQLGDMTRLVAALREGRTIDCGPSLPGSKKSGNMKDVMSCRVILVTASGNVWGTLAFNEREIYFLSSLDAEDGHKSDHASVSVSKKRYMRRRKWTLVHMSHIYLRRYRLRDTALEIFFKKGKHRSLFVDFGHTKENEKTRMEFARKIMDRARADVIKQRLDNSSSYAQLITKHVPLDRPDFNIQEQWINGHISNFDYLMAVNTIAGRSFNDLCQYPVMPWVIQQYTESTIDLKNAETYRDLSKPMGALNPARLEDFVSRYSSFSENVSSEIPAFMYGSHYSTMVGVVLYYLVRLQPFAALHKEMQSGTFDVPDRLFSSIPRTFLHNTTQLSEVKEITPEWFTCPDMFRNINNFDFGETQDGRSVSDVELPPWARTPEEFVRINREALESDFVSAHLHEWIDLIFGYKQTGQAAVAANNVFYYLTYYGKIDRSSLDERLRLATELQIAHFGQMPIQIFKRPHPSRKFRLTWKFPRQIWNFSNVFTIADRLDISDEEQISIDSSTMVFRRERGGHQSSYTSIGVVVTPFRIMMVQGNGAVESFKFGLSQEARQFLQTLAAHKKRNKAAIKRPTASTTPLKSTTSTSNASDLLDFSDDSDIISFDDDFGGSNSFNRGGSFSKQRDSEDLLDPSRPSSLPAFPSSESLLYLERDNESHSDLQPNRIPICVDRDDSTGLPMYNRVFTTCFGHSMLITGGFQSGRISIREVDPCSGFVESSGDFFGHTYRVVALASDTVHDTTTAMIFSADESGVLLLWSITNYNAQNGKGTYGVTRRPLKKFIVWPSPQIDVDLCCSLNVGVVLIESRVIIFSLERDEKNSEFSIFTSADESLLDTSNEERSAYGAKVAICNDGFIAVNIKSRSSRSGGEIRVFSMSGRECARQQLVNISFFSCPHRSNILTCGLIDGSVVIYNFIDLKPLLEFQPHKGCISIAISSSAKSSANVNSRLPSAPIPASPVMWVSVAPDPSYSGLIAAIDSSGNLFIKSLPDFISWDKERTPPSLAQQLVSVPVQAVRSLATNTVTAISSTAESVLGTAKDLAGDALNDLKRRSSMTMKSFGNFLGLGGGSK